MNDTDLVPAEVVCCCLMIEPADLPEIVFLTDLPEDIVKGALKLLILSGKVTKKGDIYALNFSTKKPASSKPWWKYWLDRLFGGSMSQCEYCNKKIDERLTVNGLCGECYRESQRWGA